MCIFIAVIDLDVIGVAVEMVLDRFMPKSAAFYSVDSSATGPESRIDFDVENMDGDDDGNGDGGAKLKKSLLKEEITTVVGALLSKQQCWEKTACVVGRRTSRFAAKDVFFM